MVNVNAYYLARKIRIPFDWTYQPAVALGSVALGLASRTLAVALVGSGRTEWSVPAIAFAAYVVLVGAALWLWPSLAGVSRIELRSLAVRLPKRD